MPYGAISAAKCRVKSSVRANAIYPEKVKSDAVAFVMSEDAALNLAKSILVLACNKDQRGDFVITGYTKTGQISILKHKTYKRASVFAPSQVTA